MRFVHPISILAAGASVALAGIALAQAPAMPSAQPPAATAPQTPAGTAKAPAGTPATTTAPGTTTTPSRASRDAAASGRATTPRAGAATSGTAAQPSAGGTTPGTTANAKGEHRGQRTKERGDGRGPNQVYSELMTPEEMSVHRAKVGQTKTYAECMSYFEATGKKMEARAKEQNKTVKATPTEVCDRAKTRGRFTG